MTKAHAGAVHGLRGLAAGSVVAFHVYDMGRKVAFWSVSPSTAFWLEKIGTFAVCAFFGISGYLILLTLKRHGDAKRFVRNRFIRIYPLFFLLNLFLFIAGPLTGYDWMARLRHDPGAWALHFLSNSFFVPGVAHVPIAQENAWSLSFEAVFYVAAGFLFFGLSGRKWLLVLLGTAVTAAALWWHTLFWFFLVGVAVSAMRDRHWLLKLPTGPFDLICLALAFPLFCISPILALLPMIGFFAAVVDGRGWLGKLLIREPWQWLGTVSYSLYLVHPFAMDGCRRIALKLPLDIGRVFFVLAGPSLAIVLSYLTYRWIEVWLTDTLFKRGGRPLASPKPA
ncbi:acyltransferase [soil metagenome]